MIKRKNDQKTEMRKEIRGGPGEVRMTHHLQKEDFTAKCRLCAKLVLPPGSGIGLHEHKDEDEVFIIQQGKGEMDDNGKKIEINAGDAVITGKGSTHSILNTGNEDLIVTAIIIQY
ncbi:MAG: cupin domain-containing protein [Elusimicrobiota bacterium]